ncbi:acyl-coenzyme A oxidase 3, peroxisomal-like [Ananas comosus]|uniref:Acyl-coenzyme A oxidase n=1 Tax=Ananas comosus TaxID=4615 RepID=A0A6P5FW03_ANACO|nr:acyl-coenzyme A oxidase 3, peroxisomal-like [Ananas comosus]
MDSSSSSSSFDRFSRRAAVIARHLRDPALPAAASTAAAIEAAPCLRYTPPELSEGPPAFEPRELRRLLDGHGVAERDWLFRAMEESPLFCPRRRGGSGEGRVFVAPDYNQTKEQQREMTMRRIGHLKSRGVFEGWLTAAAGDDEAEMRKLAFLECLGIYDHSLAIKIGVHFFLWGGAIQFFGTKRHHDKWLKDTEDYVVKGCFAMTELGHGSNVRGIETIATYDKSSGEFVINTPCESAQKYWIGGAANHATHTVIFAQLHMDGINQGVHAFIAQIRDVDGNICPNVRIADCGHKTGLNGVDNGRIWFDNIRVPRENLLNSVADVLPDGQYVSSIKDPDQRFAAFLAPLTFGRVNIAVNTVYMSKIGLAIAVRYALTRQAFAITPNGPELLLLDYPSHQRRLVPLLAKACAMSFAANYLKKMYLKRTPESNKAIHIYSSALKAVLTWQNMSTLQECREACGGQGLKTENRIGILKSEYDVQSTFEGDNNVLMQQVSKALLGEYVAAQKRKIPLRGLGLEHINEPCPDIPENLTSSILRSFKFQTDIFCLRERDLLKRYADEVSQYQAKGESKERATLLSYPLAEDLARAFTERTILQTILEAEMALTAGPLKDVLGLMRSMYSLICMEEGASFLRYGYLSIGNAAAVRKEVMALCSKIRPHALAIVSSFGIPDAFLSPIAFDWIDANTWSSPNNELQWSAAAQLYESNGINLFACTK